VGFLRHKKFSQKRFQRGGRVGRFFNFFVNVPELQSHASQHLFIRKKALQQLLPVWNLTMLEYQFQCDVFKEKVFRRTQDSREALLLLFGHGKETA